MLWRIDYAFSADVSTFAGHVTASNLLCLTDNENLMGENDALVLSAQNILMQPETLVGQRIRHQFEVDGDLSWYDGTVLTS